MTVLSYLLGKRYKKYRLKHGLSIEQVAEYLGIPPQVYELEEQGRFAFFPTRYVEKLAQLYGVTLHELTDVEDELKKIEEHDPVVAKALEILDTFQAHEALYNYMTYKDELV